MTSIEQIAGLDQARIDLQNRITEYQDTIDEYPEEFSDSIDRLSLLHQALCNIFGDRVSGLDFIDRPFEELGTDKTPRLATLNSAEGFKKALGCLTI